MFLETSKGLIPLLENSSIPGRNIPCIYPFLLLDFKSMEDTGNSAYNIHGYKTSRLCSGHMDQGPNTLKLTLLQITNVPPDIRAIGYCGHYKRGPLYINVPLICCNSDSHFDSIAIRRRLYIFIFDFTILSLPCDVRSGIHCSVRKRKL